MNAILGYAQVLRRAQALSGRTARTSRSSTATASTCSRSSTTSSTCPRSRRASSAWTDPDVDLYAVVADIEAMFRQRASAKGLGFEMVRYTNLPRWISTDEVKLRQILVNLIGNATKFTERGGVITRLRSSTGEGGAPLLVVEVEDTGPGIAPEELGLLFRPFGQTRAGSMRAAGRAWAS